VDPMSACSSVRIRDTQGNGVQTSQTPPMEGPSRTAGRFDLPADCQHIVIVGAGGFGREVLQWARDAWPNDGHRIRGFLSADSRMLDGRGCNLGILSSPDDYCPSSGEKLLLGIGVPYARRKVAEHLIARGAEFITLVHPAAIVAASAVIGEGSILCPYAIASDSCRIGRFVAMNYHTSLGHDAVAGDYAVLSPYATLGGQAHIEHDVFLGLHASVGPGKTVGARSKVSANSCVLTSAPADSLVFGVPGKVGRRIQVDLPPRSSDTP